MSIIKNIGNAARALDTFLGPAIKSITRDINEALTALTTFLSKITDQLTGNLELASAKLQGFGLLAQRGMFTDVADAVMALNPEVATTTEELDRMQGALNRARNAAVRFGRPGDASGDLAMQIQKAVLATERLIKKRREALGQGAEGGGETAIDPAIAARQAQIDALLASLEKLRQGGATGKTPAELAAEAKQRQKVAAGELLVDLEREAQLITASTDAERERLKLTFEKANLARQFPQLSNEELKSLRDQLEVNFGLTQADKARIDAAKQLKIEQDKHLAQVRKIADAIQTGITDAIMGAIDGSKTLGESLSGILKQIGGMFLQQGIGGFNVGGMGGFGLLGLLPGFANGGRPAVGRPSIVGERGPELFVPDRAGTVVPNGGFGGASASVTVNVDASGSSVEGNGDDAAQLGKAIGVAVQQELIKQKRPGGLLAV